MSLSKRNNVAIYCRLSQDDGTDQESQSIQNQKEVLTKYCYEMGFNIVDIYIDDGFSGTNFNRPEFMRMINDIERGLIDIVITKDLSRLGRDYLESGRYTEKFFPDHNVRYIALNDNVDTLNGIDDFVPFKNIINEWYAKDISKKIRFTQQNQMRQGTFLKACMPLYGYKYDSDNKRIPNPDTAPVVKRIFAMFIEGYSLNNIRLYLMDNQIKSPIGYYVEQNPNSKRKKVDPYGWTSVAVRNILTNREYLGHYIRGKTAKRFKSKVVKIVPPEEQHVFENVFEGIVTQEEFDTAQTMFLGKCKDNILLNNPFAKICHCGICGNLLYLNRHLSGENGHYEERLHCKNSNELGKGSIKLNELKEVVLREILELKDLILAHENEFYLKAKYRYEKVKESNILTDEELKIRKLINRNQLIDNFIKKLFEENERSPMPGDTYVRMMKEYTEEKKIIETEINRYNTFKVESDVDSEFEKAYKTFLKNIKQITAESELTNVIIRGVISKLSVTTFKDSSTVGKRLSKEVIIYYKVFDDFIKDFIKEKEVS